VIAVRDVDISATQRNVNAHLLPLVFQQLQLLKVEGAFLEQLFLLRHLIVPAPSTKKAVRRRRRWPHVSVRQHASRVPDVQADSMGMPPASERA